LSLGLGEEQLLDSARPASAANQRVHLMTVGIMVDASAPPAAPAAAAPAKAGSQKQKR
jgi:hypothetical protein